MPQLITVSYIWHLVCACDICSQGRQAKNQAQLFGFAAPNSTNHNSNMSATIVFILTLFISMCTSSTFLPPEWRSVCEERNTNVALPFEEEYSSLLQSPKTNPSILATGPPHVVSLLCDIPRPSSDVAWRLTDLREWVASKGINTNTLPSNRSVIYHVTVRCSGATISLPWPMKVPGLVKLYVTGCLLTDRYVWQFDNAGVDTNLNTRRKNKMQ